MSIELIGKEDFELLQKKRARIKELESKVSEARNSLREAEHDLREKQFELRTQQYGLTAKTGILFEEVVIYDARNN